MPKQIRCPNCNIRLLDIEKESSGEIAIKCPQSRILPFRRYAGCYSASSSHLFHSVLRYHIPEERSAGLRMGLKILERCDELWVFGARISEGMKAEIRAAEHLGIPVLYFSDRCEKLS